MMVGLRTCDKVFLEQQYSYEASVDLTFLSHFYVFTSEIVSYKRSYTNHLYIYSSCWRVVNRRVDAVFSFFSDDSECVKRVDI